MHVPSLTLLQHHLIPKCAPKASASLINFLRAQFDEDIALGGVDNLIREALLAHLPIDRLVQLRQVLGKGAWSLNAALGSGSREYVERFAAEFHPSLDLKEALAEAYLLELADISSPSAAPFVQWLLQESGGRLRFNAQLSAKAVGEGNLPLLELFLGPEIDRPPSAVSIVSWIKQPNAALDAFFAREEAQKEMLEAVQAEFLRGEVFTKQAISYFRSCEWMEPAQAELDEIERWLEKEEMVQRYLVFRVISSDNPELFEAALAYHKENELQFNWSVARLIREGAWKSVQELNLADVNQPQHWEDAVQELLHDYGMIHAERALNVLRGGLLRGFVPPSETVAALLDVIASERHDTTPLLEIARALLRRYRLRVPNTRPRRDSPSSDSQ